MFSEVTMERTLLDELRGVILEDRSDELSIHKLWNEPGTGIDPEHGDELFPGLAWIKNIG